MNFFKTSSQFFKNLFDYTTPTGAHPTAEHQELRRKAQGNFTGREWTPAEVYKNNVDYLRREHEEFEQIMTELNGKEKQPVPNS